MSDTFVSVRDPFSSYYGIRPIVCLKANVNAKYEDGVWILESNNEENKNQEETAKNEETIVGTWKATSTDNQEQSLGYIYGTGLKDGNELIFKEDNTYEMYLGLVYSQKGKYKVEGNKITLMENIYTGDNPGKKIASELKNENGQIILNESFEGTAVNVIFSKGSLNNDNNNEEKANNTDTNVTTTEPTKETLNELKVGKNTIKYGTYKGIDAAEGDTLVLKTDGTARINGKNCKFVIGKYNFAQDISSDGTEDAIIFKDSSGDTFFALYVRR